MATIAEAHPRGDGPATAATTFEASETTSLVIMREKREREKREEKKRKKSALLRWSILHGANTYLHHPHSNCPCTLQNVPMCDPDSRKLNIGGPKRNRKE